MHSLIQSLLRAGATYKELTGEAISPTYATNLKRWGAGVLRLVVMGEIKKGKSSFINAILGVENLVPVSSNVATSTIFKIHYGDELSYRVHFLEQSGKSPLSINANELDRCGTEDGNPGNKEEVDFIEVTSTAELLKSGIVIIDTPGLGGLFKGHKLITYQYVPRADAVFFITDSVESPIGQLELEYIRDIREITPNLFFVQTKSCAVDREAREARKKNNLSILAQHIGIDANKILYFTVDSKLKHEADQLQDLEDLEDSGYAQLMLFIRSGLQENQQQLLAQRAIMQARPIINYINEYITDQKKYLAADNQQKQQERLQELELLQDELKQWQEEQQPRLMSELNRGLQHIRHDALESCCKCRPNGEVQSQFEEHIESVTTKEELQDKLYEITEKLPEYTARVAQQIVHQINSDATQLLLRLSNEQCTHLAATGENIVTSVNTNPLVRLQQEMQTNGNAVTNLKLMGGGGFLGWKAGALLGSIVPGIGTLLGGLIGAGIAAYKSREFGLSNELKGAKAQASRAIAQALSTSYEQINRNIERVFTEINSNVAESMQKFVRSHGTELVKQVTDIKLRNQASQKEIEMKSVEVKRLENLMVSVRTEISKVNK